MTQLISAGMFEPWYEPTDSYQALEDRWALAFHDFWCQIAIAALVQCIEHDLAPDCDIFGAHEL